MHENHTLSVAYHEAAHAVAAVVQGWPINGCTLDAESGAGRVNTPPFNPDGADPADLRKYAIICLAGWEAQLHYEPDLCAEPLEHSIEADMISARRMVGLAVAGDDERHATLRQWRSEARELVAKNWDAIQRVGLTLAEKGALTGDEIAALIENRF